LVLRGVYFPAAFLSASLILSCQPGPPSWKCSRTSRSMRKETSSLAFGREGLFGAASGGFVVAALNAASAACSGSLVLRVLSKGINLLQSDQYASALRTSAPANIKPSANPKYRAVRRSSITRRHYRFASCRDVTGITQMQFFRVGPGLCICSLSEPSERPGRKATQQR
jgi:hypothetical protein